MLGYAWAMAKDKNDDQNDDQNEPLPRPDVTPDQSGSFDPNEQPPSSGPLGQDKGDTPHGNVRGQDQGGVSGR